MKNKPILIGSGIGALLLLVGVLIFIGMPGKDNVKTSAPKVKVMRISFRERQMLKDRYKSHGNFVEDDSWDVGEVQCDAGSCSGGSKTFRCGFTTCPRSADGCGCHCFTANKNSAFYAKAYCGKKSPYKDKDELDLRNKYGYFEGPAFME